MGIKVLNGGLLTTVQDLGRYGYQLFGVSTAGPMDRRSFVTANVLVDNEDNAAGLEITMMGPMLQFEEDSVIAVTGADLQPALNGKPIESYRAVEVRKGDTLSFKGLRSGCRAYVAFAGGGLDVPVVLGSRSTLLRAGFGGYQGRKLEKGDELKLFRPVRTLSNMPNRYAKKEDFLHKEVTLRVLLGPQDDRFTEKGLHTFLTTAYEVGMEFDRMGYRLKGEKIEHVTDANIASDGIAFGSVQVPGNGFPIIMAAERQPTGGYTKIANVISVDMPLLGQLKTGGRIRFKSISIDEAQDLYLKEREDVVRLRKSFERPVSTKPVRSMTLTINGKSFAVTAQEW